MDGVLVIDKPEGLTSHDVVAIARRALREKRIGHTGTLDPLATGVLPLACGRATRLVRFLTASEKDYEATIRFGLATDTYDVTGTPTTRSEARPTRDGIEEALGRLRGEYLQTPPAFSAKKIAGTRAYELARDARAVELTPVPVHVARASLTGYDGQHGTFVISCSAGFYVRTFAHDLGALTGGAACLAALRRTRSGDFGLSEAVTVQDLQAGDTGGRLIPLEQLLPRFPAAHLTPEGLNRVSHGREVDERHLGAGWGPDSATWVRLIGPDGRLIALAEPTDDGGVLHPSIVMI
jgi:tRNA pseudouridine55 synthase